jgi:hypothetical protein
MISFNQNRRSLNRSSKPRRLNRAAPLTSRLDLVALTRISHEYHHGGTEDTEKSQEDKKRPFSTLPFLMKRSLEPTAFTCFLLCVLCASVVRNPDQMSIRPGRCQSVIATA